VTSWRPSSGPAVARHRAAILRRLRAYFETESVLEVDTPAISTTAVSDIHIESIAVNSELSDTPLYLHTSPEFCMKRLLASGYPDIYSVCRVFRDGEAGKHHQPEFTMVEWYRLGFGLAEIIADTLKALALALDKPQLCDDVLIVDYRDAFTAASGVDPLSASISELADAADADADLRRSLGSVRDDWLDLILATKLAPTFCADKLTVLQHYPASQAALAQICRQDSSVADRFEVFMGTVELANGYVELTDAELQAERIANDQLQREQRGQPLRPRDQSLLAALEAGLPACAGVAVGLERLHMMYAGTNDIHNVITFPFETVHA
jgi:elongation factor P--(R)-beta-lysine ligase